MPVLGMRLGWGWGGSGGGVKAGRLRGSHSLVEATEPAQMGQLRNNTQQTQWNCVLRTWSHSFRSEALAGPGRQPGW